MGGRAVLNKFFLTMKQRYLSELKFGLLAGVFLMASGCQNRVKIKWQAGGNCYKFDRKATAYFSCKLSSFYNNKNTTFKLHILIKTLYV